MLIDETITAEIIVIRVDITPMLDKSKSSFSRIKDVIDDKSVIERMLVQTIFIMYFANNPFESVAEILGIKRPPE